MKSLGRFRRSWVLAAAALTAAACGDARRDEPGAAPPPIVAGAKAPEPSAPDPEVPRPKPAEPVTVPSTPVREEPLAVEPQPAPVAAPAKDSSTAPQEAPARDPLAALDEQRAAAAGRATAIAAAERDLAEKEALVVELDKRLLAVKNPLLPRPQLPPDEAEAWKTLDGVGRMRRVESQLATARADVESARSKLDTLRRGAP